MSRPHRRSLSSPKVRADAVLDAIQTGLLWLDSQGRVVGLNRAMRSIIPAGPSGLGCSVLEVTGSAELQRAVDMAMAGPGGPTGASGTVDEDGAIGLLVELPGGSTFDVVVAPVLPGGADGQAGRVGRSIGWVAEFRDVSRVVRLLQVRRDFVANVTHELKTPLTSIRGYAETLLDGKGVDSQTRRRFLEVILKNADHMIRMVRRMLELSRLESESRTEPVPVDAAAVLHLAAQSLIREAEAKFVRIEGDLAEAPAVLATTDGLGQVFRNLLENAIRFSPEGGIIRVTAIRRGGDIVFSVADEGRGIPADKLERVFERFYTIKGDGAGASSGSTGLGLAICRHIIRNLGGEIRADSPVPVTASEGSPVRGTTFTFTLRAADCDG